MIENNNTSVTVNNETINTIPTENVNVKAKKSLPKIIPIIIGIIAVVFIINLFGGSSIENIAIGCAKTVISDQLKAPSSAIWHDCKIIDKDSYGRYLVYINVEATNSFGGYVTNEYLVVVKDVKKSGEFSYNPNFAVQSVNSSTYDLVVDVTKELNSWNEPTR